METSAYFPYRSEKVRDSCFAYLDALAARQWPVTSESRLVPTTYGETFVRIDGPAGAPPLVLLPGAATTSLMWSPNIGALSAEFRTYAVDRMGEFGRSICARPLPSFKDLLTWLDELLDGLGLERGVNMAGVSYGGALTALYALNSPQRLNRVVLLAPANTVLRLRTEAILRFILATVAVRRYVPSLVRWMFAGMAKQDPEWVRETIELLFVSMRSLQFRKVAYPPVLTDAEWGSLRVPALFLVGQHEVIYSAEKAASRLARVAPKITTEIVPGAGHDLTFVQAAMVNRKIIEFLKQEPAESEASRASSASA